MFSRNLLRASADIAHEQTLKLIRNIEVRENVGLPCKHTRLYSATLYGVPAQG